MQSASQTSRRISHSRHPALSFHPLHFPSDRQFPLYAHCNSQRYQPAPRLRCSYALPSDRQDLMQTVDYRYPEKTRQSSFALSDIFELDEEEVEIEISPILPSTPNSASSISTNKSVKLRMKTVLIDLAHTVKTRWGRARPMRMYVVEPADRSVKIDIL